MTTKTVVELPYEDYQQIKDTNQRILDALQQMKVIVPDEYIPRKEFMAKCGIGHTKFAELVGAGKIKTKNIGRKAYVLSTEVQRFFRGDLLK